MAWKIFQNNQALTAEDLNDVIVEQAVLTFADATERNNAIPSPNPGMHCHLLSTKRTYYYDASNGWIELLPGTVSGLTARTTLVCTSTTRPAHAIGRQIIETDTKRVYMSDGTAWYFVKWLGNAAVPPSTALDQPPITNVIRLGLSVPHNTAVTINGWAASTNGRISPITTINAAGTITLNVNGVYHFNVYNSSDSPSKGTSVTKLILPGGQGVGHYWGMVENTQQRPDGYPGAGGLKQSLAWSGYVSAGQTVRVDQFSWSEASAAVLFDTFVNIALVA